MCIWHRLKLTVRPPLFRGTNFFGSVWWRGNLIFLKDDKNGYAQNLDVRSHLFIRNNICIKYIFISTYVFVTDYNWCHTLILTYIFFVTDYLYCQNNLNLCILGNLYLALFHSYFLYSFISNKILYQHFLTDKVFDVDLYFTNWLN